MNKEEHCIYIVRGDTCEPWDYQVYSAFSDFDSAMIRAAEMVQKLKRNGETSESFVANFRSHYDIDDCDGDCWTGLLIEGLVADDPKIPSHYGDSCYSACKECHEVTLQELLKNKLI